MAELFKVLDSKQTVLMFLHSSNQEISCAVEFNPKIRQKKYKFREHLRSNGFFSGIGSYISGSALEKTLYQLGMCQPGVMSTVLSGKHCNFC